MKLDPAHNEASLTTAALTDTGEGKPTARPVRRRGGYRYARRRRRRSPAVLSLNLTAMIDTVFNLLFFFMVATRFGAIEGLLPAHLPAKASATAPPAAPMAEVPRTPIRIRLSSDPAAPAKCRATIDGLQPTPVDMSALPATMARIRATEGFNDGKVPVYLLAGDDVAWDHVVNAYNAAISARYERVFFAGAQ